ncbi:hypothetical protein [Saccharothrix syringae]|uniref:Uncharacterized protein n=1 Tax=Saccharothrix syringae TaxID=103733 RepID=A0A5Q0GYN9_SACSY|nr:hypothetical protein [Saccharothrix syringae]QFZ19121.1 hypothetical protein EKG83_18230 [Saccharothrix syringae]
MKNRFSRRFLVAVVATALTGVLGGLAPLYGGATGMVLAVALSLCGVPLVVLACRWQADVPTR